MVLFFQILGYDFGGVWCFSVCQGQVYGGGWCFRWFSVCVGGGGLWCCRFLDSRLLRFGVCRGRAKKTRVKKDSKVKVGRNWFGYIFKELEKWRVVVQSWGCDFVGVCPFSGARGSRFYC